MFTVRFSFLFYRKISISNFSPKSDTNKKGGRRQTFFSAFMSEEGRRLEGQKSTLCACSRVLVRARARVRARVIRFVCLEPFHYTDSLHPSHFQPSSSRHLQPRSTCVRGRTAESVVARAFFSFFFFSASFCASPCVRESFNVKGVRVAIPYVFP